MDTLDVAVIDLTLTSRINHIHYVAPSRLESLVGLHITKLQEDKIYVDKRAQIELKRLRNSSNTRSSIPK